MKKKTLNLYVDGFNLYFGLRSLGSKYKWLDLAELGRQLCKPDEELGAVKYFTARIKGPDKEKIKRQTIYLEALQEVGIEIIFGKYQKKRFKCPHCEKRYFDYEEKESDVNLGTILVLDSAAGGTHTMAVISADSDLILPMEKAKDVYAKNVVAVFPPNRHSKEIKKRIGKYFSLSDTILKKCQLPSVMVKANGYKLVRPANW